MRIPFLLWLSLIFGIFAGSTFAATDVFKTARSRAAVRTSDQCGLFLVLHGVPRLLEHSNIAGSLGDPVNFSGARAMAASDWGLGSPGSSSPSRIVWVQFDDDKFGADVVSVFKWAQKVDLPEGASAAPIYSGEPNDELRNLRRGRLAGPISFGLMGLSVTAGVLFNFATGGPFDLTTGVMYGTLMTALAMVAKRSFDRANDAILPQMRDWRAAQNNFEALRVAIHERVALQAIGTSGPVDLQILVTRGPTEEVRGILAQAGYVEGSAK